jgi:hypothetical protein
MIKSISTQSPRWVMVYSPSQSPYISPGSMSAGMVRYNSGNSGLEVYDGNSWLTLTGHADVGLSPEAQATMEWAYKKMKEDEQLEVLMQKHPGLKDLHDKFELMKALVAEDAQNCRDSV